jgi:hypothetical protein
MINTAINNKLDVFNLHKHNSNYYIHMSELDFVEPIEDSKGRFYFEINIEGECANFYQSGEQPNIFLNETDAYIFSTESGTELHIINDYV